MWAQLESWMLLIDGWTLVLAAALLGIELLTDLVQRRLTGRRLLDTLASLSTQIPAYLADLAIIAASVVVYYAVFEVVTPVQLPINAWTIALAILAADLIYYWEHRWAHEVRLLWLSHAVHHSSRIMNTSVAYRFGPLEGVWSALIHLPLILIGFDPMLVFLGQVVVLAYQFWIHTELIGKLGPLEGLLNTPSNHRVHHGCDAKYLDRNYGGILIVWDRLFGTYQPEEERPVYGLARDFDSVNPLKVWFSEFPGFFRDLAAARSLGQVLATLFGRPGHPKPAEAVAPLHSVKP